ncbi:MAG: hypothetical protein JWM81_793 [Candidatus Saccharibacteria bacterium]|nr:hypothetical protein [Candidatus Saccharibacteria bacterium]
MITHINPMGKKLRNSEGGFAAIVIAIVLVTVLSLLTIGFAQLMNQEQKSALDKQLANTAYYAAESGINDAVAAINAGFNSAKPDCAPLPASPDPGVSFLTNNTVDTTSTDPVTYSCLLIDPSPTDLLYEPVGSEDSNSKVAKITGISTVTGAPAPIARLVVSWADTKEGSTFATNAQFAAGSFPGAANWKNAVTGYPNTGILRVQLAPLTTVSRDTLTTEAYTSYLYPADNGSGTIDGQSTYGDSKGALAGKIYDGKCSTTKGPYFCSVSINGLNAVSYLLRLNSLYSNSKVKVEAYDAGGHIMRISGAQTSVDSTGNARGVLKRIQVRLPSDKNTYYPQYGLESLSGICKKLVMSPESTFDTCQPLKTPTNPYPLPPTVPPPTVPVSGDIGPLPFDLPSRTTLQAASKKVFAHYIPSFPISIDNKDPAHDYYANNFLTVNGESGKHAAYGGYIRDRPLSRLPLPGDWLLTDMKTEITRASGAGIDGFTTDVLSVSNNTWPRVQALVQAASELNNGFKIIFMPDGTTLGNTADSLADTLSAVAKGPNRNGLKFLPDGRLVVSPFDPEALSKGSGDTVAYWTEFVNRMRANGVPVAFIPCSLNYSNAAKYAAISYGYSIWGSRNPGQEGSQVGLSNSAHAAGKIWMQPVSVQDERPYSGLFNEAGNSENFRVTWQAAIDGNADWVQIPTWNDYYENSEIGPSSHIGWSLTDLASYYLTKYKLGAPAIVRDVVYLSHRIQPWAAKPSGPQTLIMKPSTQCGKPPCVIAPRDTVEALTFLTNPATVKISVGGQVTTYNAPAGVSAKLVPLNTGEVSAEIDRSDGSKITVTSAYNVQPTLVVQNLHYFFDTSGRTGVLTEP